MAETDNPDSNIFDKAYELVRFMEADPKFKEKGIQPTIKTFNLLLKCYLCTKGGVSEQVDAVLDDIAKRKAAGQSGLEMEEVTYHRAFKAYISCKNIEKALAFVESMGNSNCPPTMDTYATVLKCVSALADESDSDSLLANAELTGSVLMRLREIARPTVGVLSDYCYNLSLSAWGRCGPESSDRLLQIYDLMAKDHVPYNKYTYDKVISVLTKSTRHDLIEKADSMLREMLDDKLMQPEIKHFICVANAWITLGEKYSHQASGVLNLCFQKFVSANVNHDAKLPGFFVAMLRTFLSQGDAGNADDFMNRLLCLLDHGSEFSLDVKLKVYSFIQDEMNHADGLQNFKKEKIEAMIAEVKDRVNLSAS
jgi:pentatricopeptide repeat protein